MDIHPARITAYGNYIDDGFLSSSITAGGWRLCRPRTSFSGNEAAMSSRTTATLERVHRNPLFPSDRAHPDGESCNEQAYRDEGQNVVDEIGHAGNSSLFTYVYFLFYFCSKVNPPYGQPVILWFTNNEYKAASISLRKRTAEGRARHRTVEGRMFGRSRTSPVEAPPAGLLRMRCHRDCDGLYRSTTLPSFSVTRRSMRRASS